MKMRVRSDNRRICAFCEYWYNGNILITPAMGFRNTYDFDSATVSACGKRANCKKNANHSCQFFQKRPGL